MTSRPETVLYSSLLDVDRLEYLAREGIDTDILPTAPMRPVVEWAINYYFDSGCKQAPSEEALRLEWGSVLEAEEIVLEPPEDEYETAEWALKYLRSQHVHLQWQQWIKRAAEEMAASFTDDRLEIFDKHAAELAELRATVRSRTAEAVGADSLTDALRRYEERRLRGDEPHGMMLGLAHLDAHTNGIHPGELAVMAAGPKAGKAHPLSTLVLTPQGWTKMGDLRVGDQVIGSNGRPTEVVAVHPQGAEQVYRVTMSDNSSVLCSGGHLWNIQSASDRSHGRGFQTVDTRQVAALLAEGKTRHTYVPMVEPVQYDDSPALPIEPYALGLLLGDGCFRSSPVTFSKPDRELGEALALAFPDRSRTVYDDRGTVGIGGLRSMLEEMGLDGLYSHQKFVPEVYLRASVHDRLALLQGLMDTDGGVEFNDIGNAAASFCTTSPHLRDAVVELTESLGGICRVTSKVPRHQGGAGRRAYILRPRLPAGMVPFRLRRKRDAWLAGRPDKSVPPVRKIVSVHPEGVEPTQCITVAAEDGLYVTERFIVTHNSWVLAKAVLHEWRRGRRAILFTLENSVEMTMDRIVCLDARVNYRDWQRARCTEEELHRVQVSRDVLAEAAGELIVVMPPRGQRTVESMTREARIRGADSLAIDQLTFVEAVTVKGKARHEVVRDIMHDLKTEISTGNDKLPCLLAHQINREGVKAADKTGYLEMYMLAESSEVERTADWVFGLYRSHDERIAELAKLQVLAARREDITSWLMRYDPASGLIETHREIALGTED